MQILHSTSYAITSSEIGAIKRDAFFRFIPKLIKTITKFSNVNGYQLPVLSSNWTVYASCLQLDSTRHLTRVSWAIDPW